MHVMYVFILQLSHIVSCNFQDNLMKYILFLAVASL